MASLSENASRSGPDPGASVGSGDVKHLDDILQKYRDMLVEADQNAQENFDKTLIALSGGGLGVSLTFIDKVIGTRNITNQGLLIGAWFSWTASLLVVLASFYLSHLAIRRAISRVDVGKARDGRPGGRFGQLTVFCNGFGAVLFIIGTLLMGIFVTLNL